LEFEVEPIPKTILVPMMAPDQSEEPILFRQSKCSSSRKTNKSIL